MASSWYTVGNLTVLKEVVFVVECRPAFLEGPVVSSDIVDGWVSSGTVEGPASSGTVEGPASSGTPDLMVTCYNQYIVAN